MRFVIYGAFAEGYVKKATVDLSSVSPCSNVFNAFALYTKAGIDIDSDFPVVMPLSDGTLASGFDFKGVTYFHFVEGHVPEDILVREA